MTISGLIALLEARRAMHGDLEVFTTWEGTVNDIYPWYVYKSKDEIQKNIAHDREKPFLAIDADSNSYKDDIAADINEGEESRPAEDCLDDFKP